MTQRTFGETLAQEDAQPARPSQEQERGDPAPREPREPREPTEPRRDERRTEQPANERPAAVLPVPELPSPRGPLVSTPNQAAPTSPVALAVDPAVQDLARQMLRQVSVHRLGDQTALKLRIATPRLPRLGLDLRLEAGSLRAKLDVPEAADRELLRSMTGELESALAARGLLVAGIEVDLEERPAASGERRDPRGRGQGRRRDPEREEPRRRQSKTDYVR